MSAIPFSFETELRGIWKNTCIWHDNVSLVSSQQPSLKVLCSNLRKTWYSSWFMSQWALMFSLQTSSWYSKSFHLRRSTGYSETSTHLRLNECNSCYIENISHICTLSNSTSTIFFLTKSPLPSSPLLYFSSLFLWGNLSLFIHHRHYSVTVSPCVSNNSTSSANTSQPKPRPIQSPRYESA